MKDILANIKHFFLWVTSQTPEQIWDRKVKKLLEGFDEKDKPLLSTALKNQDMHNNFVAQASNCDHSDEADRALNIAREFLKALNIRKLIGCQPMQGPVGVTYMLQYIDSNTGEPIEGKEGERLELKIVDQAVEAGSRKLATKIARSTEEDINKIHGLDLGPEVQAILGKEIAFEVTAELLSDLRQLGKKEDGLHKEVTRSIRSASSYIAMRSRRGAGNWIVVTPTMLDRIEEEANLEKSDFERYETDYSTVLPLGALLNGIIKIYVDWANKNDNEILVGYKGVSETDAGYFYNPYVPIMPSGIVLDPDTYEPLMTLMTRFGKTVQNTESIDESNYYTVLTIK